MSSPVVDEATRKLAEVFASSNWPQIFYLCIGYHSAQTHIAMKCRESNLSPKCTGYRDIASCVLRQTVKQATAFLGGFNRLLRRVFFRLECVIVFSEKVCRDPHISLEYGFLFHSEAGCGCNNAAMLCFVIKFIFSIIFVLYFINSGIPRSIKLLLPPIRVPHADVSK